MIAFSGIGQRTLSHNYMSGETREPFAAAAARAAELDKFAKLPGNTYTRLLRARGTDREIQKVQKHGFLENLTTRHERLPLASSAAAIIAAFLLFCVAAASGSGRASVLPRHRISPARRACCYRLPKLQNSANTASPFQSGNEIPPRSRFVIVAATQKLCWCSVGTLNVCLCYVHLVCFC